MPYPPIVLDRAANRPLYRQIEVSLRRSILDGRIGPGTVLPGIRAYAKHLGVAAVTVMTAYDQLTAEGYLEPRPGRGTVVAPDLPDIRPRPAGPRERRRRALPAIWPTGPRRPFFGGARREPRYDFRTGATRLDLFPVALWERLLPRAWRDLVSDPASATTYRYPEGDPRLRAELAAYLGLSRAVRTSPDQVVVTAGAQSAMATAARLWLGDGRTLARRGSRQPPPAADLRGLRDADGPRPGRRPRPPRRPPARRPGRRDGHAVVAVPERRHDAGRAADAAARLGRAQRGGDHRGRLRQRAALRGPSPAVAPGPRRAGPGPLRRDVQQGALPGPPRRVRGRARAAPRGVRRAPRGRLSRTGRARAAGARAVPRGGPLRAAPRPAARALRRAPGGAPRDARHRARDRGQRPARRPRAHTWSSGSRTCS